MVVEQTDKYSPAARLRASKLVHKAVIRQRLYQRCGILQGLCDEGDKLTVPLLVRGSIIGGIGGRLRRVDTSTY